MTSDNVEQTEQFYQIFDMLTEIAQYQPLVDYDIGVLSTQDFIDKWEPTYIRIMQMKAFL
jgi:uncharacterized protein YecA (UPF0149 family)